MNLSRKPALSFRIRPPCVKGAVSEADWGIVALLDNPSGALRHLPLHKGGFGNGLPRQCEHWLQIEWQQSGRQQLSECCAVLPERSACPPGCCSGRTCLPVFDMTTKNRQKRACLIDENEVQCTRVWKAHPAEFYYGTAKGGGGASSRRGCCAEI